MERALLQYQAEKLDQQIQRLQLLLRETREEVQMLINDLKTGTENSGFTEMIR